MVVLRKMSESSNTESSSSKTLAEIEAKEHIDELRSEKFSIGAKHPNPLTSDLHRAVTKLSAELYTKDVHFLMELIQNAEDNQYGEDVEPTLELVLTRRDITGSGAPATLVVFNNEVGFSKDNMVSLCSVGHSTKKGKRDQGFIGEKGIGFKSVFLVSKEPHIISNGYKVKLCEEPNSSCGIGYIVPEWVGEKAFISNVQTVYGSNRTMPTTTIVLPLKPEKVQSVKEQLSTLHPELLLFLCKIKKLYVRSSNSYYKDASDICAISISHETQPVVVRSKKADSRIVHLAVSSSPDSDEVDTCQYYIWRQSFLIKTENKVHGREDVKEWSVSLAFPVGDRLTRRSSSSSIGIFAFLPTAMFTNFPFIVQADFLLASSRESIILDNKWNLGILSCVPSAFVNAFTSFVKDGSALFTADMAFKFLPVEESPVSELNKVRENIKLMLCDARIMPCETFGSGLKFCKPLSALRILPDFRQLLVHMKEKGVSLDGLCSMRNHPVDASLDVEEFDKILDFLCVLSASESSGWYEKCISACKLISQASDTDYIEMLWIFANNEEIFPKSFFMKNHVFKYIDQTGQVELCNACKTKKEDNRIWFAMEPELHVWLNICNSEFNCSGNVFLLPNTTQAALVAHEQGTILVGWLSSYAKIDCCSAYTFSLSLCDHIVNNLEQNLLLKMAHFFYHSHLKGYLSETDLSCLMACMPIIDGSNTIQRGRRTSLVRMEGSKWAVLFGYQNPFAEHGYHELGPIYSASGHFAGECTHENLLLSFMEKNTGALDIPEFFPPNIALPAASSKLTSEQAFLLLDWIKFFRGQEIPLPAKFIASIRNGNWMKTNLGFNSPSKCVLPNEIGKRIFEMASCVLNGLSILDEAYYMNRINLYLDELSYLGVTLGMDDVQKVAMSHFKAAASSEMSKNCAISLLTFVGLLKERDMLDNGWLVAMMKGRWLRTSKGNCSPNKSVLLHSESQSEAACRVTSLPVIHRSYYGSKLESFSAELALLGVTSDQQVYELVPEKIVYPVNPVLMTSSCGIFLLECIRHLQPNATSLIENLQTEPWLKTNLGFWCPVSTIFPSPSLSCLLSIVEVPTVDELYYGRSIQSYTDELVALGVGFDFSSALKIVANQIHKLSSSSQMSPSNVISLLQGIRNMLSTAPSQLHQVREALLGEELFKTRCGYRKPNESILSNQTWASISLIVDDLPMIDDSYHGIDIYRYQDELEVLGVIVGLEDGAHLVAKGLTRPIKASQVTAEGALTLLRSIRVLMSQTCEEKVSLSSFLENIMASEFLKTSRGNRPPKQCVLLQPQWIDILQLTDLPCLDDVYYGNRISEYQDVLECIGVKLDEMEVCLLLFESLYSLSESSSVKRYYQFLHKYFREPELTDDPDNSRVWIPGQYGSEKGQWVSARVCIVHDQDKIFGSIFHCLDNYYDQEMLPIFPKLFGVAEVPGLSHYLQLWVNWLKRENHSISSTECHSFWGYILSNWSSEIEEVLKQNLTELPAVSSSFMGIQLISKEKLFFPDDLLLKRMFMSHLKCPPFVWLPKGSIDSSSSISPVNFQFVYDSLGVKRLSESVEFHVETFSVFDRVSCSGLKDKLISKGLMMIILAYLSGPKVNLGVNMRHRAVQSVLSLSVHESSEPILLKYILDTPDCAPLKVESRKVVHWDRESCSLLIDKSSYIRRKVSMEFGSCFSQELAEGIRAQERLSVAVNDLGMMIQLGFDYEFEKDSVEILLMRENLELFLDDEKFIEAAFPSEKLQVERSCKRICPSTPVPFSKKQKRL